MVSRQRSRSSEASSEVGEGFGKNAGFCPSHPIGSDAGEKKSPFEYPTNPVFTIIIDVFLRKIHY
jgi:hypothetical protein